jgi:hypothetical protein
MPAKGTPRGWGGKIEGRGVGVVPNCLIRVEPRYFPERPDLNFPNRPPPTNRANAESLRLVGLKSEQQ